MTSLSVLVPVYNEQYLVVESLKRLDVLKDSEHLERIQVIVVDDCSKDGTPQILLQYQTNLPKTDKFEWLFLRHDKNKGKGGAIQTALQHANCDLVVVHDSDLEYYPKDLLKMVDVFMNEQTDAVYGSRFASSDYRKVLLFKHQLGNKLLTFMCNLVSDYNLTDMETCYKMVKTSLLKSIPIRSNDFRVESEITIKLAKRQARVFEVPINYCGRTYQEGKKINWKDGVKAIWAIVKFGLSDDIYVEDPYGSKILARLSRAHRFNKWMADTIKPYIGETALEVGAGVGNLTKHFIPKKSYYATDINPLYLETIDNLKTNKPYLNVQYLDVQNVKDFTQKEKVKVETVICLNVIEHVEDDLTALKNISDLLSEKGKAVLLVPHLMSLFSSFDKVLGHKRRYSSSDIKVLAGKAGFSVKKIIYFNRIGVLAWVLNGKILKKKEFGLIQVTMLNILTPIFRLIDNLLPWPSLSIIAILEK